MVYGICQAYTHAPYNGINMLITVNARRRQTYTHACLARGRSVTQTRCIASLSEIAGAVQISPDQSPSAISASLSLLTQLPHPPYTQPGGTHWMVDNIIVGKVRSPILSTNLTPPSIPCLPALNRTNLSPGMLSPASSSECALHITWPAGGPAHGDRVRPKDS